MIIFFTPGGRIGNQLFQYARVSLVAQPNELLLFSQMEYFLSIFNHKKKVLNIRNGLFLKVLERSIIPFLRLLLVDTGLISSIIEKDGIEKFRVGCIRRLTWMEGYFQKATTATIADLFDLELKETYITEANDFLYRLGISCDFVFVHIRRSDYLKFDVLGEKDPSLPNSFYHKSLLRLGFCQSETTLVLLGDDPKYAEKILNQNGWKTVVSDLSPAGDFALMTLAAGGVISNSTFAWWAGRLNGKKIAAPLYWLGWKSGRWYPEGIMCDDFTWVEV